MIHDADTLADGTTLSYDVCVIGSGPAGMTLINELRSTPLRCCVLESGQAARTTFANDLKNAEAAGIGLKPYSRERALGGTSTTWAGLSAPLDPIDFGPRDHADDAAWPLARHDLLPFYRAASERYGFPPFDKLEANGAPPLAHADQPAIAHAELQEKPFMAANEPRDFGAAHRHLFDTPNPPDLYLDASVKSLSGMGAPDRVRCARAMTRSHTSLRVEARVFVVAAGGIENARLFFNSTDICARGLGNEYDQLGRRFMNHPKLNVGTIELRRAVTDWPYYFGAMTRGFAGYAGLRLAEKRQRELGALNSYVRLEPLYPWSGNPGVESLVAFVKRSGALFRQWKHRREDEIVSLRDYSETGDDSIIQNQYTGASGALRRLALIARHAPTVARYGHARLRPHRAPAVRRLSVRHFLEMTPSPENRVTLSRRMDAHGYALPHVRHALTGLDRRSVCALHAALGREVERAGLGTLHSDLAVDSAPLDAVDEASHHLGATRMGHDPASSVVDADGRVHGLDNVFLAGGSVFPTGGCANPTYTIVALSIRLARHLEQTLGSTGAGEGQRAATAPGQ